MDFTLSEEQLQLRNSVRSYLTQRYPTPFGRPAYGDVAHTEWWRSLSRDLGVTGLALPPDRGGFGGDPVDVMIVMEEFGAALVDEPFIETVVLAGRILAGSTAAEASRELICIASGNVRFALAHDESAPAVSNPTTAMRSADGWVISGNKKMVIAAPWADKLIVSAHEKVALTLAEKPLLFIIDPGAAGVALSGYATVDGRCAADISFTNVAVASTAELRMAVSEVSALDAALDAATAAQCAEALGIMRRILKDTIDYTQQRKQFGKTLADFQVLRHRMADMAMELESAVAAVYLGTLKLAAAPRDRARAISAMKVTVSRALRFIWQNGLQLHGGMGMTEELAVGHYAKRAIAIERLYGAADWHLRRFAALRAER